MTVLKKDLSDYKKLLNRRITLVIIVAIIAVVLNVLLCVFRSDSTHIAFLVINIITDISAGCFVAAYTLLKIAPERKLYKLCIKGQNFCKSVEGEIESISNTTTCVYGFRCFEVKVSEKTVYMLDGVGLTLCVGEKLKLKTVQNIIISAEVA